MKLLLVSIVLISALLLGCASPRTALNGSSNYSRSNKNGEYHGKGKITKINQQIGSVELDHEDIPGLMPAMVMEFYLTDKSMLSGLAVGDSADFTILYSDGTEKITKISRNNGDSVR